MTLGDVPPFSRAYLSAWTTAWAPDALILAATAGYAILLWRRGRQRRPIGPPIAWAVAMLCLVVCFNSSIGIYSDRLFWVHMIQHLILIMVIPPLLIWAAPWGAIPTRDRARTWADVLTGSRAWRAVTNPFISVPVYTATVVLTHLTSFQQIAVGHTPTRIAENVLYLVVGYVLFAPLLPSDRGNHQLPDLVRFVVLAAAMGADTLTGIALMMTERAVAPAYAASHPGWGPAALPDQHIAGALMWFAGDGIMMVLMVIVAVRWGLRHQDSGLGDWLEGIRRRQILGTQWSGDGLDPDVDLDQAALDAYNAYLAELQRRDDRLRHPAAPVMKNPAPSVREDPPSS